MFQFKFLQGSPLIALQHPDNIVLTASTAKSLFGDKDPILGAVGALQFEVLQHRLQMEYAVDVKIEKVGFTLARWVVTKDGKAPNLEPFERREDSRVLVDRDDLPVILFRSEWAMKWAVDNHKEIPVHFVGSIAFYLKDELEVVLNKHGIKLGNVLRRPIDGLIAYHVLNK